MRARPLCVDWRSRVPRALAREGSKARACGGSQQSGSGHNPSTTHVHPAGRRHRRPQREQVLDDDQGVGRGGRAVVCRERRSFCCRTSRPPGPRLNERRPLGLARPDDARVRASPHSHLVAWKSLFSSETPTPRNSLQSPAPRLCRLGPALGRTSRADGAAVVELADTGAPRVGDGGQDKPGESRLKSGRMCGEQAGDGNDVVGNGGSGDEGGGDIGKRRPARRLLDDCWRASRVRTTSGWWLDERPGSRSGREPGMGRAGSFGTTGGWSSTSCARRRERRDRRLLLLAAVFRPDVDGEEHASGEEGYAMLGETDVGGDRSGESGGRSAGVEGCRRWY